MSFKPMLASDAVETKIKFPCIAQPKIDGVRSLNMTGILTGRSLKKHANEFTTSFFSDELLKGFDGEMAAHSEVHPDLCRMTTSALNTITGHPFIVWHVFDYVTDETHYLPYSTRASYMAEAVAQLRGSVYEKHIRLVPSFRCETLEQLLTYDETWLDLGYEGTIVRDPEGFHKQGRSTVREGGLLRIKRFIEAEAVVIRIIEGQKNLNEATINELGLTERSTHQENMVPNGMVGALECRVLKDVVYAGKLFFKEGQIITVSAGRMTHDERLRYFNQPELIVSQIIKFKTFPKGVKDKPRFPTFQTIRAASDM